jgi:hypothetical protein
VSTSRLRSTAAAVALALAVLALSGCATNQAGAASIVGDARVTDAQVADVAGETQAQLAGVPGTTYDEKAATTASLTMQTRHLILAAAAEKEGITVTQGEVDAFVKDIVDTQFSGKQQALLDNLVSQSNVPASQVSAAARDQLIYNALLAKIAPGITDQAAMSKAFTDYMKPFVSDAGVQIAPRYGTWDVFALGPVPDDLSFVPAAPPAGGKPIPLPNPAG